jgi:hypothetical protein
VLVVIYFTTKEWWLVFGSSSSSSLLYLVSYNTQHLAAASLNEWRSKANHKNRNTSNKRKRKKIETLRLRNVWTMEDWLRERERSENSGTNEKTYIPGWIQFRPPLTPIKLYYPSSPISRMYYYSPVLSCPVFSLTIFSSPFSLYIFII